MVEKINLWTYHREISLIIFLSMCFATAAQVSDFSDAVIYSPVRDHPRVNKYLQIFQEEVQKRTGITLPITHELPSKDQATFFVSQQKLPARKTTSEGFSVFTDMDENTLYIHGHDHRGILYGIGWILRKMDLEKGKIRFPEDIGITSSPAYPIRGHQLGYRPKTNAYDAWSVARFDQYIRDLAIFGANSIEIMPPRTDDDFTSEHMQVPASEMIVAQSKICDSYDMDVWMWYPNMGSDYVHPDSLQFELNERHQIFSSLPRLDHLFVPGGDPGELDPTLLFTWLKKVAVVMHQYHPNAKIWVSPQVFRPTQAWFDIFYKEVNKKYAWFGGVVFGPWVKVPIDELRAAIDPSIPIRRYPDITHSLSSQYPIPEWDLSFAATLGRECINPRPIQEKIMHNALDQFAQGSISYSEGTNDDVNKFIWSGQDWDPDLPAIETLRDYARFFIDANLDEEIAQGLVAIENNCIGPIATNDGIDLCLQQWQKLEATASPRILRNFRFQMGLIRAYYDAYVQQRYFSEKTTELKAKKILATSPTTDIDRVLDRAISLLQTDDEEAIITTWKDRCEQLADSLFNSIGAQLTVARHGAMKGRGNFVDQIDVPLTDAPWLLDQLHQIRNLPRDKEKLKRIAAVLHRTDPGPGGYYDNFGTPQSWNRIKRTLTWSEDPGSLRSSRVSFGVGMLGKEWVHEITATGFAGQATPLAWMNQVTSLYDQPLVIEYDHLNPDRSYKIRVAYTGRFRSRQKLEIDGTLIHDFIQTGVQPTYEFDIPQAALRDGKIELSFNCGEGERGSQVSELWILCGTTLDNH